MLFELRVRNLAIIESLDWQLGGGLNVITGETGAGKSLVIDAVETLLEGRVGEEDIRHGSSEAHVEGVFDLPQTGHLQQLHDLLDEKGLKSEEDNLVISCESRRHGRSTLRINGHAVTRAILQQVGGLLIDIHGQSQHLSLLDTKYHLDFLDGFGHTMEQRQAFAEKAAALHKLEGELKSLLDTEKDAVRRQEFLRFQLEEIKKAELHPGEDVELEKERTFLASAEKLQAMSFEAYQALCKDEAAGSTPALDRLNEAVAAMKKLVELDPTLQPQLTSLEEAVFKVEEAAREINDYSGKMEHNPQRQEEVEARFEVIKNLKRKYGHSVDDILSFADKTEKELEGIFRSTERQEELQKKISELKAEMGKLADELSSARAAAADSLVAEVRKELQDLSMSQVDFQVSLSREESADGLPLSDGKKYVFTADGVDTVEFMASTNPGEPVKPITKIASTGEISRFTLALKCALSEIDSIPILIFDEIDIGVGGRSGEIIGKKLWDLARNRQVICVTHLPQIAAYADAHYNVHKEESGERTVSKLQPLEGEDRTKEIAVMFGGAQYTEASLIDAREAMRRAQTWRDEHATPPASDPVKDPTNAKQLQKLD